ncbi:MAG: hypothetical protein L3J39_09055, partial [Verrucomicrobiales bacterium]|nr:hypothetical protein [Verrucomicrobiales bacterium]
MPDPEVGILIEYIKLDHLAANKLLRKFAAKAADAKELRDTLDALIEKGDADLLETVWLRAQSGHRAQTMSVREDIYPTEYDPPEILNIVGNITAQPSKKTNSAIPENNQTAEPSKKSAVPYIASAAPTAFETRNVGVTLEVDLIVSQDQKTIHISLAPEIVTRLAERYFTRKGYEQSARGIEHISMPTFYTMKTSTQLIVIPGKY